MKLLQNFDTTFFETQL